MNAPLNVHRRVPRTDAGRQDVACTECDWTCPSGTYVGHGTAERPGGADLADRVMPHVAAHIDETGHRVRLTLTTWVRGVEEQSATLIGPSS